MSLKCFTCGGKGCHGKTKEVADELMSLFGTVKKIPKDVIPCKVCKGKGRV